MLREIDNDPFLAIGVWQPQMRGPVLDGESGEHRFAMRLGLGGGEAYCILGEGIVASGGREETCRCTGGERWARSTFFCPALVNEKSIVQMNGERNAVLSKKKLCLRRALRAGEN